MMRSPSPVCTEHEEKGGPHGEELQRRTTEPKPKRRMRDVGGQVPGERVW